MSPPPSTEQLVAELVDALEPVRPLPALRWQLAGLAAAWLVTAAAVAAWQGLHPALVLGRSAASAGVAAGMALLAISGLAFALAVRIPGRERAAAVAAAGGVLSLGMLLAVWLGVAGTSLAIAFRPAEDLRCLASASLFSLPPGVLAGMLAMRAVAWRPVATGFALALGACGGGALLTHLACLSDEPWHWLFGHSLGPMLVGVAAGAGLCRLLARQRQRAAAAPGLSDR